MDWLHATCPRAWPLSPSCSHLLSISCYVLFGLLSLLCCVVSKRAESRGSYARFGTTGLPLLYVVSAVCSFLLLAQTTAYLFYVFYVHEYSHLLLVFAVTRPIFWTVQFCSIVGSRHASHLPITSAIALAFACLLQCLPMTAWSQYFPSRSFSNGEFVFFVTESALVFTAFLAAVMTGNTTIRVETQSTWSNFSRKLSLIMPYVWPKKSVSLQMRVAFCLFLLLFGRLINVALPLYNKWIVDGLAHPATFSYSLIVISSILKFLQGNGAMGGFLNTLRSYIWVPIQQYTTREIEVELFEHLHALSLRWHLSRKTGMVLRVMDRGTNSINQILSYLLFNILPTLADILIAVIFFFSSFDFYFGLIVLVTMISYLVCTIYITEWRTQFRRDMNEKENVSSAIGTDSLLNYETVKYYSNEKYEVDRFRNAIIDFQEAEWRANASLALLNFTQNSMIGVGMTLGSILVAYLIKAGNPVTVGDYVLFTTYMLQLYAPLNFFGTVYRTIQKAFIDMENMFDLMNEDVEVKDSPGAVEYSPSEGRITVTNLSFEYNEGKKVLEDVSFDVRAGETVALVGPSGSGKSTIVRLLFRLFEAKEGSISYDGMPVQDLKMATLRRCIGIVPQDTVLFNDTIRYNIRFGRPGASDEEVEAAAKAAMIHDKILTLPHGYDTVVGERGLKLSGGEKQRVAIARTILKEPRFIFLDEATSALDTHTERAIQRCLEELCATRTSVVVAHRLSTVVHATQVLVLDKGRIAERGTHSELLERGGIYARMWASQMADDREGGGSKGSSPKTTSPPDTEEEKE